MLFDAEMIKREADADEENKPEHQRYPAQRGSCATNSATIEIVIATAQGQRCNTHSSHGTSPPQYCEDSAAPSTTALAASTKPAKARVEKAQVDNIIRYR